MKRARSSSKKSNGRSNKQEQYPLIPLELLAPIAAQMTGWSVAQLVRFSLVCTAARNVLPLALQHWVMTLREKYGTHGATEDMRLLIKCLQRHSVDPPQLTALICSYVTERAAIMSREESDGDRLAPKHITFLQSMFDLQKLALQEAYWLLSKVDVPKEHIRVDSMVCQTADYNAKTKLRHVFYYDNKTGQALPLKKLPGLRTVELPAQHVKVKKMLIEEIQRHAKGLQGEGNDAFKRLAHMGLDKIGTNTPLVRELCCQLLRDKGSLVTHKPHRKSLLCNAVMGTNYVFGAGNERMQALRNQLYTCHYKPVAAASDKKVGDEQELEKTKQFVVAFQVTNRQRFVELQRRLGLPDRGSTRLPAPVVRPDRNVWSLEESDYDDDYDSEGDEEPTQCRAEPDVKLDDQVRDADEIFDEF
jgi:hypothetical protein